MKYDFVKDPKDKVAGILGQGKLSQASTIQDLLRDRRARIEKHNA